MHITKLPLWVALLLLAGPVLGWNENWREETKEMLEEGREDAALFQLEEVANDLRNESDAMLRLNTLRFLGEVYWMAEKPVIAQDYFTQALKQALELDPIWKRLSAVISVLELHQKAVPESSRREPLLQATLQAGLLPEMAKNHSATEIGRYIKTFEGARRLTLSQLLAQIRLLQNAPVRTKALYALTKIAFGSDTGQMILLEDNPPYSAEALEKLLWHAAMARMFDTSSDRNKRQSHLESAYLLLETLPQERRPAMKKMLKSIAPAKP